MSDENRKAMDTARADPQCYMCNIDTLDSFSCSNCMMQHQLDRIEVLEKKLVTNRKMDGIVLQNNLDELREVLRELIKEVEVFREDEGYEINMLSGLLAKLDVGSARLTEKTNIEQIKEALNDPNNSMRQIIKETEKKEGCECDLKKCYDEDGNVFALWCYKCGTYKLSGGEVSGVDKKDITEDNDMSSLVLPNDSKPPEPCNKCGSKMVFNRSFKDEDENTIYEFSCSKCNNKDRTEYPQIFEDRLPGGTGTEPREDDYTCRLCGNEITLVEHEVNKLTVEVKREDLQRWKKEFEISGNPEWEYIEEAYGIE